MSTMTTVYLLTGDIGGTNSRMRLYDTGSCIPLAETDYRNQEALIEKKDGSFEEFIVAPFLQECWRTVKKLSPIEHVDLIACFACAGPVRNNAVHLSNLGVTIDGKAIEGSVYCQEIYVSRIKRALIINDFVAQGYGCLTLEPREVRELTPKSHKMIDWTGPKVCVGAGTGLGQCFLTRDGAGYACYPSEGGHVEYNPRSDLEIKLRSYLMQKFNCAHRTSIERVVSGIGLANVYEFLAQEFPDRVDTKVHEEFENAGDMRGKTVSDNAVEGSICKQALDIMISAYGSEVGCAAIKWIPTGGLFVTGGLTPKNIKHIQGSDSEFMKAYYDKGRVSAILDNIPLFAVMVEDLGVRGVHKVCKMEHAKMTADEPNKAKAPPSSVWKKISAPSGVLSSVLVLTLGVGAGYLMGKKK